MLNETQYQHPKLFFVKHVQVKGDICCAEACLLDPLRAGDLPECTFSAWIIAGKRTEVRCRYSTPETNRLRREAESDTDHYIHYDPALVLSTEGVLDAAQNIVRLEWDWPAGNMDLESKCPFFLASNRMIRPYQQRALLELVFRNLRGAPDLNCHLLFFTYDVRPIKVVTRAIEFGDLANSMLPAPGQHFPIMVMEKDRKVSGVAVLEKDLGMREFYSLIYLSDNVAPLRPGAVLYRQIWWQQNDDIYGGNGELGVILEKPTRPQKLDQY